MVRRDRAPVSSRLLRVVHLSSERTLEPVRKDCAFAEKQQPQAARLLVVQSGHISLTPAYMTYAQLLAGAPEGSGFAFADESLIVGRRRKLGDRPS